MAIYKKLTIFLVLGVFLILIPLPTFAEFAPVEEPSLSFDFGGGNIFTGGRSCEGGVCTIAWIGQYVAAVYRYGVGLVAVLAVVAVMVGGFLYIASAGMPDRVKTAKGIIFNAFAGLTIALFSFMILQTLNPRLVALDPLEIKSINEDNNSNEEFKIGTGCCLLFVEDESGQEEVRECLQLTSSSVSDDLEQRCLDRYGSGATYFPDFNCQEAFPEDCS